MYTEQGLCSMLNLKIRPNNNTIDTEKNQCSIFNWIIRPNK